MSDLIGRITVPTVINSAQTFRLTTQYPFGFSVERPCSFWQRSRTTTERLPNTYAACRFPLVLPPRTGASGETISV
jgi:hypothetical protein